MGVLEQIQNIDGIFEQRTERLSREAGPAEGLSVRLIQFQIGSRRATGR
jgi:hypothetical protein